MKRAWLPVLAALLHGCETAPRRRFDAVDAATYTRCEDAAAAAAWQRAQAAIARAEPAAALPDLLVCVQRCLEFVPAHLAYQDCARQLGGKLEQAMVDYYVQLPVNGSPVPAYLRARLAETSYAQCNALEAILAEHPSFAWAHLSRARVTRRQGRLLASIDMFSAAIVNDPQLHGARLERAQVLAELGREEEAARDYRAYLQSRDRDAEAIREFVALLLYRLSRVDEAIFWLDRLEQLGPVDVVLRMDRAAALWRANQPQQAAAAYLDVLATAPDTARAALNIGLLYYEVVPRDEAARRRFWPAARAAFRWFLRCSQPADGHEQFERTLGVPFRLQRIDELLGEAAPSTPDLEALRWPAG